MFNRFQDMRLPHFVRTTMMTLADGPYDNRAKRCLVLPKKRQGIDHMYQWGANRDHGWAIKLAFSLSLISPKPEDCKVPL